MHNWYSIHDLDNLRLGFVPFIGSNKQIPLKASSTLPTAILPNVEVNVKGLKVFGFDYDWFMIVFWSSVALNFVGILLMV